MLIRRCIGSVLPEAGVSAPRVTIECWSEAELDLKSGEIAFAEAVRQDRGRGRGRGLRTEGGRTLR
jgi:hypothetical protein